ncbi:MAG: response regulator [Deltaproteobacteria bacterium]|nr:response regulator [Deltaproteobacteria bacterium]
MAGSILVVDDNQNFQELLKRVFTKRGYEVKTASNGEEALDLLQRDSFGLAVLDLRMDVLDGIALLKEIRRHRPTLRSIIVTGYPTEETRNQAFENGALAYLTKPVDLGELTSTVDSLIAAG